MALLVEKKLKIFRSPSSSATTPGPLSSNSASSSSGQATQFWKKYILGIECLSAEHKISNYSKDVEFISGLQFMVHISSPLLGLIKNQSISNSMDLTNYFQQSNSALDSIECLSLGVCYVRYPNSSGILISRGQKIRYSPVYYCVQYENAEALRQLLSHSADVTILPEIYSLQSTNLTPATLLNVGGREFTGKEKILDTFVGHEPKEPNNVDLSSIPEWGDIHPTWKLVDSAKKMTPLQLAFSLQNYDILTILLDHSPITDNVTEMSLSTTLPPFSGHYGNYPPNLSNLRNLLSLHIHDPLNYQAVPMELFTLVQLEILNLQGSGFTILPDSIAKLICLKELRIANMSFQTLPLLALSKLPHLEFFDCSGLKIPSPPAEIIQQGPEVVARYVRDLGEGAVLNTDVLLMFIGDGESGKTSTLNSLKNTETNNCERIGVDDRTIGIDICDFLPDPQKPLKFFAWDFAGQGVYAMMQQLFMSKRAIYPLLWRVRQSINLKHLTGSINMRCDMCGKNLLNRDRETQQPIYRVGGQGLCHASCVSYDDLITSWTERLQFRVPGVTIVLIATHIDSATTEEVNEQCNAIKAVTQRILKRQEQVISTSNIPQLKFYGDGDSIRINNMTGEGIADLRAILSTIAESLPSYGEVIPTSYAKLRCRLREMHIKDSVSWRTWLQWDEYADIAKECGIVDPSVLHFVTRFFHDLGELRYFGQQDSSEDDITLRMIPELLQVTVFPNPYWIVDVLRGLIRHDHGEILKMIKKDRLLSSKQAKILRRRVYRLMQQGLLHKSLLPFIWHGVAGMHKSMEQNDDEFSRLIALMQAFDILMDKQDEQTKGTEWIVPCLASGKKSQSVMSDNFVQSNLAFVCRLVYDALPPFFDIILVAHIMNTGIAESVNFIASGAAAFRYLSETVLLCAGMGKVHDPKTVFRIDQLDEGPLQLLLREDQKHIVIASSCRSLLIQIIREIGTLERYFPGLKRLCTLFPCYSCRMKKKIPLDCNQNNNELNEQLQIYLQAEEKDLQMKSELPKLDEYHTMKHVAYYCLHMGVFEQAEILVPEVEEFLGKLYTPDQASKLISGFCSGRENLSLRSQQEAIFLMDNILKAIDLNEKFIDTCQKKIETIQKALSQSHDKLQMQLSSMGISRGSSSVSLGQLKDLLEEHHFSIGYARRLLSQLDTLCDTLVLFSETDTETIDARLNVEICHEELLPLTWNSALEPLFYLLSLTHACVHSHLPSHLLLSQHIPYDSEKHTQLLPHSCLDINLLSLYFPDLIHDTDEISTLCFSREMYHRYQYDLLSELHRYLQLTYPNQEGFDDTFSMEIIEYQNSSKELSSLQALLQNPSLVHAATHVNGFPSFIDEICGSFFVYHPQVHDEVWIQSTDEQGTVTGDREQGIWKSSFSNNLKSQVRPRREFPPMLTTGSNMMRDELSQVVNEIQAITTRISSNFRQDTLAVLSNFGIVITDSQSVKDHWDTLCNEDSTSLFLLDSLFDSSSSSSSSSSVGLFDGPPLPDDVDSLCLETIRRYYDSKKLLESLQQSNPQIQQFYQFNQLFLSQLANTMAMAMAKPMATTTAAATASSAVSLSQKNQKKQDYVTTQMIFDFVNYYFDALQLLFKEKTLALTSAVFHESFLEGRKDFKTFCLFLNSPPKGSLWEAWNKGKNTNDFLSRVYVFLFSLILSFRETNPVIDEFYQLKEQMIEWESMYPIIFPNPEELGMEELLRRCLETTEFQQLTYHIVFYCRHIGKTVSRIHSLSKTNSYDMNIMSAHALRLASYLKSKRESSLSLLPKIIDERMMDLHRYFDLFNQLSLQEEDTKRALEIVSLWNQQSHNFKNLLKNLQNEIFYDFISQTNHRIRSFSLCCVEEYVSSVEERMRLSRKRILQWNQLIHFKSTVIQSKLREIEEMIQMKRKEWKKILTVTVAETDTDTAHGHLLTELQQIYQEFIESVRLEASLVRAQKEAQVTRVQEAMDLSKGRVEEFQKLMRLRLEYGPPWYFGSGSLTERLDEDLYENDEWEEDWMTFIVDHDEVCKRCPGEYEESERVVQPDETCAVFISHSTKNPMSCRFAKQLRAFLNQKESGLGAKSIGTGDCHEEEEEEEGRDAEGREEEGRDEEGRDAEEEGMADERNEMKQILSKVKTIISCIDRDYSTDPRGLSEYRYAETHNVGIIPIILPDYQFESYQHWWPSELPSLSKHSLFVDMRALQIGTSNDDEEDTNLLTKNMISSHLLPTLRAVLSEWKPIPSTLPPLPPPLPPLPPPTLPNESFVRKQHTSSSSVVPVEKVTLDRFIPCENCYLEGVRGSVYDRVVCQQILEDWKIQELLRREAYPNDPIIPLCPETTLCSGSGSGSSSSSGSSDNGNGNGNGCGQRHESLVRELLAMTTNRITIPCPECVKKGIFPPFLFQREQCLAEFEYSRKGSLSCHRCRQLIPLLDLLQSEVFLSYSWGQKCCPLCTQSYWESFPLTSQYLSCGQCGETYSTSHLITRGNGMTVGTSTSTTTAAAATAVKYSTQLLVQSLKYEIELEAGVTCWQDIDRLVGGKDLEYEMEVGIKQADVVIMFLDDNYLHSNNCRKEYLFATKHSKYIIPVILKKEYSFLSDDHYLPQWPGDEKGEHGGEGEEHEKKAEASFPHYLASSAEGLWCPPYMSSLLQFSPIILDSSESLEHVIFEISERIQSRFHRSSRFPTVSDAIDYIHDYSSWGTIRKALLKDEMTMSARDAMEEYLTKTFHVIDRDGNLEIDREEFTKFLDENVLSLSEEEITQLINEADLDCDGNINLTEFKLALFAILDQEKEEEQE